MRRTAHRGQTGTAAETVDRGGVNVVGRSGTRSSLLAGVPVSQPAVNSATGGSLPWLRGIGGGYHDGNLSRYGSCTCCQEGSKWRNRKLLVTTKTDENAIAAPAIIGLSKPNAARGSAATL